MGPLQNSSALAPDRPVPATGFATWNAGFDGKIPVAGALPSLLQRLELPIFVVGTDRGRRVAVGGTVDMGVGSEAHPLCGYVAPCLPEQLGDPAFCAAHGLRYAYVAGAMANGIASEDVVEAMASAGMLAFFGAAGLSPERVERAIDRLQKNLLDKPFGCNLIHSPNESDLEAAIADLYIRRGVRLVEASAYLRLTLPIVRYRVHGIHRDASGAVVAPNKIIAKVSRVEIAQHFFTPPPEKLLAKLVESGDITAEQARLAEYIPMAQDVTAEADSGGHTDNRPAIGLLPTLLAFRDQMQARHHYAEPLRVGLGGGIATPASALGAFAMGAAYVLTGTINQACVEAGTSDRVRQMLAEAGPADVAMAPAADMFEMGVKLQVLKRGTMFAQRAGKLYELYRAHGDLDAIPAEERAKLEATVFRKSIDEVWRETKAFFAGRDPRQIERAARDKRHKMALVFRWYLGQSSNWANAGLEERQMDYQVWCGPAMGAFNEWVRGSWLETPANRRVVDVARNILYGAAVLQRVNALRQQGVCIPADAARVTPLEPNELEARLDASLPAGAI
ncbi:MAG: PfaD family polyunsaturated fatty acid/polyketide biosynthesis protein [Candidatus Hydrogenedentales bacterium]